MIDTLHLKLYDCSISENNKLAVTPATVQEGLPINDHHLFRTKKGTVITGSKAFYNSDLFNIDISPVYDLREDFFNTIPANIKIRLSLPKYNSLINNQPKLNLNSVTPDEQIKIFRDLNNRLQDIGILTDVGDSNITRLDSFLNISLEQKFTNYSELFKTMRLSRKETRNYNNETFLYKNNQGQIAVYDKNEDVKTKLKIDLPGNLMRIENRIFKKKNIKNRLKVFTLDDLQNNMSNVKQDYKENISKNIFKYDSFDSLDRITVNDVKQSIEQFKNNFGRNWLQMYFNTHGVKYLLTLTSREVLEEAFKEVLDTKKERMKLSRIRKIIDQSQFYSNLYLQNLNDLYSEIKNKFYKQVA